MIKLLKVHAYRPFRNEIHKEEGTMANNITADIGFEKQIWDAACVLRGNMDASEYKNVVLGLIFLKLQVLWVSLMLVFRNVMISMREFTND